MIQAVKEVARVALFAEASKLVLAHKAMPSRIGARIRRCHRLSFDIEDSVDVEVVKHGGAGSFCWLARAWLAHAEVWVRRADCCSLCTVAMLSSYSLLSYSATPS